MNTINEEFNEFMEYDKGSHNDKKNDNRRNGSTSKGSMYAKGNSLKDIKDTIREIYSIELSEETLIVTTKATRVIPAFAGGQRRPPIQVFSPFDAMQ